MKTVQINDYSDNPLLLSLENIAGITTGVSTFVDVSYVEVHYIGRTKIAFYANKAKVQSFLNAVQDLIEGVSHDRT